MLKILLHILKRNDEAYQPYLYYTLSMYSEVQIPSIWNVMVLHAVLDYYSLLHTVVDTGWRVLVEGCSFPVR